MSNARSRLRARGYTEEQLRIMTNQLGGPENEDLERLADFLDAHFPARPSSAGSPHYEVPSEKIELARAGAPPALGTYTPTPPYGGDDFGAPDK